MFYEDRLHILVWTFVQVTIHCYAHRLAEKHFSSFHILDCGMLKTVQYRKTAWFAAAPDANRRVSQLPPVEKNYYRTNR